MGKFICRYTAYAIGVIRFYGAALFALFVGQSRTESWGFIDGLLSSGTDQDIAAI